MTMNHISGSLSLKATASVELLTLPSIKPVVDGFHLEGRLNGSWWLDYNIQNATEVLIPARQHRLSIISSSKDMLDSLSQKFSILDTTALGSRHLHKLYLLMQELGNSKDYSCVVNNKGSKGTFAILSSGVPINMFLMFDTVSRSVQLVWSTKDLVNEIRETYGIRFYFYHFPTIINRPIFIHTQTLCAHWWRWSKGFGFSKSAELLTCNAAELYLYKDPTKENL